MQKSQRLGLFSVHPSQRSIITGPTLGNSLLYIFFFFFRSFLFQNELFELTGMPKQFTIGPNWNGIYNNNPNYFLCWALIECVHTFNWRKYCSFWNGAPFVLVSKFCEYHAIWMTLFCYAFISCIHQKFGYFARFSYVMPYDCILLYWYIFLI